VIVGVVQDYVESVIPHRDINLRVNRWRLVLAAGVVDAVQVFQVITVRP